MTRYSVQPRNQIFIKDYGVLSLLEIRLKMLVKI